MSNDNGGVSAHERPVMRLDDGLPVDAVRNAGDLELLPAAMMYDALGAPRKRYVRVSYEGSHMVLTPEEAQCFVEESEISGDETPYIRTDTYLSEREFEDLPEHEGF
jgi:hypothetical protein